MEIGIIGQFLTDEGLVNAIDRRLKPARVLITPRNGVTLSVCVCDGDLYLEDITQVCRGEIHPLAQIALADPNSFDKLLEAVYANSGGRG